MTLQQLRYFVVAAQLNSFTKAAEQCFVTQPALSRSIADLEAELGCPLFSRSGKSVALTQTGNACLLRAQVILEQLDMLTECARMAREGVKETLSVGYIVLGHLNAFLRFINEYAHLSEKYPQIFTKTQYDDLSVIKQKFYDGAYDFIILPKACCTGMPPLDKIPITKPGISVIVHKSHPMFTRSTVSLSDLKDQRFVFYGNNDMINKQYLSICRLAGFSPNVVGYGHKMGDIINEIIQKSAVAFTDPCMDYISNDAVRLIPLSDDVSGFYIQLVKLKSNNRPAAKIIFDGLKPYARLLN